MVLPTRRRRQIVIPPKVDIGPHARMRFRERGASDQRDLGCWSALARAVGESVALGLGFTGWSCKRLDPVRLVPVEGFLDCSGGQLYAFCVPHQHEEGAYFVVTFLLGTWAQTSAPTLSDSREEAEENMAARRHYSKGDAVEVCIGGSSSDPNARWVSAKIVDYFSDGVQVRFDEPIRKGKSTELAVKFSKVRPAPLGKFEQVLTKMPTLPSAAPVAPSPKKVRLVESIQRARESSTTPAPAAPPPPPPAPASSDVLLAEVEAALALAAEPMRRLEARLAAVAKELVEAEATISAREEAAKEAFERAVAEAAEARDAELDAAAADRERVVCTLEDEQKQLRAAHEKLSALLGRKEG